MLRVRFTQDHSTTFSSMGSTMQPFGAKSLNGPFDFLGVAGQLHVHPTGGFANIGAPDVGDHLELMTDLIDDRFFDFFREIEYEIVDWSSLSSCNGRHNGHFIAILE